MMAVALEQEAALAGRTRCIQAGDRPVALAQHPMIVIYGEPAFGMDEHGAHRAERNIRPLAKWLL